MCIRDSGHDQQDNGERGLFEFEVIGVDAGGRQGREIHAERRRAGGDDQAVADAGDDRDVSIGQQMCIRDRILWIIGFIPQIAISLLLAAWFTDLRLKLKGQTFFKTVIYMPIFLLSR